MLYLTRSKKHDLNAHGGVCSGIAFSPVNHLLICSCGLDGKIQFFDIIEGKNVKIIDTKTPLSAISFCPDGHTIAVGTFKGKLLIYDLKDAKKVKIELKGTNNKKIKVLIGQEGKKINSL